MKLQEQGALRGGLADPYAFHQSNPFGAVISFVEKTLVIAELELRRLHHDATELITRAVQPAL